MKPRSDTNARARPQRRARHAGHARNQDHEENSRTSLSRELRDQPPADRSATERESETQGSEFTAEPGMNRKKQDESSRLKPVGKF